MMKRSVLTTSFFLKKDIRASGLSLVGYMELTRKNADSETFKKEGAWCYGKKAKFIFGKAWFRSCGGGVCRRAW